MSFQVWVPTKNEIASLLREAADVIDSARELQDVEKEVGDIIYGIDCHIYNRVGLEKGTIKNRDIE